MIVDAKPRDLGLPTDAYYAVEEIHDVSTVVIANDNVLLQICCPWHTMHVYTELYVNECLLSVVGWHTNHNDI